LYVIQIHVFVCGRKDHFKGAPDEKDKYLEGRLADIQHIIKHGWFRVDCHLQDGNVDTTKSIVTKNCIQETYKLGADVFWESWVFQVEFGHTLQEAGYEEVTTRFADGSSLTGAKIPDDGKRPLPKGAHLVERDAVVSVGLHKKMKVRENTTIIMRIIVLSTNLKQTHNKRIAVTSSTAIPQFKKSVWGT